MTQRDEADQVEILSGVVDGLTLGSPIALLVRNKDQNSGAYDHMKDLYRPSHADFTTEAKYGIRAVAGGGRASARETIGRVAAAAVARKLLAERFGIEVLGWVSQIHTIAAAVDAAKVQLDARRGRPDALPGPGGRGRDDRGDRAGTARRRLAGRRRQLRRPGRAGRVG